MNEIKISVITPVFKPNLSQLEDCLASVNSNASVEHILGVDGPNAIDNFEEFELLLNKYLAKFVLTDSHGGISAATNAAAKIASGDLLLLLDQDDFLVGDWQKEVLQFASTKDIVYSDRHTAAEDGSLILDQIFRKPAWSPTRLLGNMYISHFFAINRELFASLGGMRSEFDGSQDHDLALRALETNPDVKHIALPLYAWRQSENSTALNPAAKSYAVDAGLSSVNEHHERTNKPLITVRHDLYPGFYVHKYPKRHLPVSVVIPTAFGSNQDAFPIIRNLMTSIAGELNHSEDEVVIVSGGENDRGELERIEELLNCRVIHVIDNEPFNFSRRVNLGAIQASNEMILFLNDDVEFVSENPIDSLMYISMQAGVGAVGAHLLFPDGSLQHAGHAYYKLGAHHPYYLTRDFSQHFGDLILDREISGVTAACLMQRKSVWREVGGFTTQLPSNYNDVDFCLKIREAGYSIVLMNSVIANHYESTTRDPELQDWEVKFIRSRWSHRMWIDKFTRNDESVSGPHFNFLNL
jgi:GT2 family glycosyltransferase